MKKKSNIILSFAQAIIPTIVGVVVMLIEGVIEILAAMLNVRKIVEKCGGRKFTITILCLGMAYMLARSAMMNEWVAIVMGAAIGTFNYANAKVHEYK